MRYTSVSMERSNDASDLLDSHRMVQEYHSDSKDAVAKHYDFLMGRPWSEADELLFAKLNKEPVVFHEIKASERTVLGLFVQNRYDVKFSPADEGDQDISDVWNQLYTAIGAQQDWAFQDIDFFRQAWAGGAAYQEVYVKVQPGQEPRICTRNQNFFAIYPDPESRDLMLRRDARFIDRVSWLTFEDLMEDFPDVVSPEDAEGLEGGDSTSQVFEKTVVHRDRSHENYDQRNGKFKVIERFYKVKKKKFYTLDKELRRMDIRKQDVAAFRRDYPQLQLSSDDSWELHLAIACPAWDLEQYLYKGPFHCHPKDEQTGELIWPIMEMVAEGLNGQVSGFVEPQESPSKIINSMMSNILGSAKHAANTSYLRRRGAFDPAEAKKFDKHHSDNDRVFEVSDKVDIDKAVAPIPKGETNRDNTAALDFAMNFLKEVSSTPPALQGQTEEKGASGILNAQRIEQAYIQLQVLIANWKMYLRQRAKLIQYYVRTFYTYEKTFRILDKTNGRGPQGAPGAQFVTINKLQPSMDSYGRMTGALEKLNDVSTSQYDIVVEDSYQSPTFRYKTQQQISELLQTPAVQADPILMGVLLVEFVKLSDVSQDLKEFVEQHSAAVAQASAQQAAMQQQQAALDQAAQMQGIAQTEAEQTTGGIGSEPPGMGGMAPGGSNVPPSSASGGAARKSLARRPTAFAPQAPATAVPV